MKDQEIIKQFPFKAERIYHAPIERVWKAVTEKEEMKKWYFDMNDFKANVGFKFQFNGGNDCEMYVHLCQVIEVIPQKKLSYSWCYEGFEGESLLIFELFEEGNNTRLKLTHQGLHTFPQNNKDFALESFAAGWTMILDSSLTDYLQKI